MIQFVKAFPEDSELLTSICRASKGYWGYPPEWLEWWKDELTIDEIDILEQHVSKILKYDELIGFFALNHKKDYIELEHLWIKPQYIGQGFGKLTLEYIQKNLIPIHAELHLLADPNAESFYHKNGFITYDQEQSAISKRMLPRMKWSNRQ